MLTRKTQYGWLATAGLLGLFFLVLACKLRDGARAAAQSEAPPAAKAAAEKDKKEAAPPALEGLIPLDTPGNPLPPIDDKKPGSAPLLDPPPVTPGLGSPSPVSGGTLPATMPMSSPPAGAAPLQPLTGSSVMPANYSHDPMAGAAGTETSPLPPPGPATAPPAPPVAGPLDIEMTRPPHPANPTPPSRSAIGPPGEPSWDKPGTPSSLAVEPAETHPLPGEPPLAPSPGPVQTYQVRTPETMRDLARRTLGAADRWTDIHKLNPLLKPETPLAAGTVIRLPGDACVSADEGEPVKPLPSMHPKAGPARPKVVLPLTGTYPANLDDKKTMTLPAGIREQLTGADTLLVSPGPDQCLWLTNQAHLERLSQRLEQSPAREIDVRIFKRLYYAQTEKAALDADGRVSIPERLAQFAGLHQEVILVGIDDHFEVWDAARWRLYTQQKSAGHSPAAEQE
jgi:MraZ protein